MTKFVTPTDALILSPIGWPSGPDQLPEVFDAFARAVTGLQEDQLTLGWNGGRPILAHRLAPDFLFHATPILRDGWTVSSFVPAAWQGRVTRSLLAVYFHSDWLLRRREPSWGAMLPFRNGLTPLNDPDMDLVLPAKWPLVDPLRDTAAEDDQSSLPVAPELDGPWAGLFTPWEHTDAFLAGIRPGEAWLLRRATQAVVPTGRMWWEIRGLRDAGDASRYGPEMWDTSVSVAVFLGWHAYAVNAAGRTIRCLACGRLTIEGRRYCGAAVCNRARAAARQRTSRTVTARRTCR